MASYLDLLSDWFVDFYTKLDNFIIIPGVSLLTILVGVLIFDVIARRFIAKAD